MIEGHDSDEYLSRGLSSAIRRHRARVGEQSAPPPVIELDPEPMPSELVGRAVVGLIARGGVGLVYRVDDSVLGRELALKVLSRRFADEAAMVERFEAEARICAQLQHPGVVPIHEVGRLPDGRPYFTMKLVEGDTLATLLAARRGPEPKRRGFVEIFQRICQTMAYAHSRGVVHGDLKPSNVMVGAFGEVQVMDWGFARQLKPEQGPRSSAPHARGSTARVLGTPAYMSPEQARGDEDAITPRTDVFGLGAILCEILTGKPPYFAETRSATYLHATQCWQGDARQALDACGGDAELVALASRCLESDAQQRPPDAAAVADVVSRHLEGLEARARERQLQAAAADARAAQERRSRKTVLVLGAALLLAVVVVAGALLWLQQERAGHDLETRRLLAELIGRGRSLADRARAADERPLFYWAEAQAALDQAAELAETRAASGDARDEVASLLGTVRAEAAVAQRQDRLERWVEAMRPHYTDDRNATRIAREYRAGFARFGFGFAERPEAVVQQIHASPIADVLCAAVDDWARVARNLDPDERHGLGIEWRSLVDIARRADPHPFRDRLRLAFRENQVEELRSLADDEQLRAASPATRNLLAKCLFDLGATEPAIEVLRALVAQHPDDYWAAHDLALFLRRQPVPPADEILGLCLSAVAVRPADPHARCDLAFVLAYLGDRWGAAGAAFARARELSPDYSRPWGPELLVLNGRFDEALVLARTNAERSPEDASGHRIHGWAAHIQGEVGEAVGALRRAAERQPGDPGLQLELASALADSGDLDGARAAVQLAREQRARAGGMYSWSVADELLAAALDLARDPVAVAGTDGWPDLARGTANYYLGNAVRAAEELRDGVADASASLDSVHLVMAARAAIAASRVARAQEEVVGWQLEAVRHLGAAVASVDGQAAVDGDRRFVLTTLRWLQQDPLVQKGPWHGEVEAQLERVRETMNTLARRLLGD